MNEIKSLSISDFGTTKLDLHFALDLSYGVSVLLNVFLKLFDDWNVVCHGSQ
jgi:hypothetical protein